jgi:hypothetical protein
MNIKGFDTRARICETSWSALWANDCAEGYEEWDGSMSGDERESRGE